MEFVSWNDEIPNMMGKSQNSMVPNHQAVIVHKSLDGKSPLMLHDFTPWIGELLWHRDRGNRGENSWAEVVAGNGELSYLNL